ncbi:SDR family oxidoreductase [Allopusillimonas ginsengisoli]|uniref:SDR family oxidoreductase n=1 Tax=Allopusillimonas ginsengisoli TaxID=453575 RepID=UPI001021E568|nr:SDR family oxidoreductase [Allopusillimonas ginsengisoli]TEA78013.1 SDR family oxidoreductase [Allopusillimonas ginsengisoli]
MQATTVAIVTGASRGLGQALAMGLLGPDTYLCTVARTRNTELAARAAQSGAQLQQIQCDLADPAAAEQTATRIMGSLPTDAQRYLLINNAGIVDPVGQADQLLQASAITAALTLNITSVMLLTAAFVQASKPRQADSRILNISSGAGRNPTPGWSVYCASKAALDHYTRVLACENHGVRAVALAPGVIDTAMQHAIRGAAPADFPNVAKFQQLHEQGQLSSPEATAARILRYIVRDDFGDTVLDDIRNYD